jgi:cytochrome b561
MAFAACWIADTAAPTETFGGRLKLAAKLSHYALYVLMIGIPLIGWGMLSAASYPVVLFWGVHLPAML